MVDFFMIEKTLNLSLWCLSL